MKRKIANVRGAVVFALVIGVTALACAFDAGTGTLSALGIGSIASLCPVGALEVAVGAKSVSVQMLLCAGVAVVLTLVLGKAFCSWACPTTYLQRFFRGRKARKDADQGEDRGEPADGSPAPLQGEPASTGLGGSEVAAGFRHSGCAACGACAALEPVGGKRNGVRIDSRHVALAGAVVSSFLFGFPVFCLVCPVGLTFATLIGLWHLFQYNETTWGLLVFPAVLLAEVLVLRRWCFNICPISALLGLVSGLNKTFKPQVDESLCLRRQGVDCRVCVSVCPEQLDPHSGRIPECSKCGLCVDECPAGAIAVRALPKRRADGEGLPAEEPLPLGKAR